MKRVVVGQLLHGYRKGHQLLAGSARLPAEQADIVARLSDLSGSLPPKVTLVPYLTAYPLGSDLYALARTWPDTEAPRAGCVLTHTLLIPLDAWRSASDPQAFSTLFVRPDDRDEVDEYKAPKEVSLGAAKKSTAHGGVTDGAAEFVRRFFAEGVRPLVWFDADAPEDSFWAATRLLWPAIRERFTCCTFALQPRLLGERPFDLMFAPGDSYPRFHALPREGILRPGSPQPADAPGRIDPWVTELAKALTQGGVHSAVAEEAEALGPYMGDDPSAVRHLFLIRDLKKRLASSPTAGVGLLDAVGSLAPGPDDAAAYKADTLALAIQAAESAAPAETLRCMFLLSERLTHPEFQRAAEAEGPRLAASVTKLATTRAEEALAAVTVTRPSPARAPYFEGLLAGLELGAERTPEGTLVLSRFPELGGTLVGSSPRLARGYLRGAKKTGGDALPVLIRWLERVRDTKERKRFRSELLSEVEEDREAPLADELLRGIGDDEVRAAVASLFTSTSGFRPERLRQVVSDRLASEHPDPVRSWANESPRWSAEAAEVVASAYAADQRGFQELLTRPPSDEARRADITAAFIERIGLRYLPGWFRDEAARDCTFLGPILAAARGGARSVVRAVTRVLDEVPELPIARDPKLVAAVAAAEGEPFFESLVDASQRSAIRLFVAGVIDEPVCRSWHAPAWAERWFERVQAHVLQEILRQAADHERAWAWLAAAPRPLYGRKPAVLRDLTGGLVSACRGDWTTGMGRSWATVLRRATGEAAHGTHLGMCADALNFSFKHTRVPVSPVVVEAFCPVYAAVVESPGPPPEVAWLFGFFDWDKAKHLRRSLIDAFLDSSWPPGDLALAARDDALLRKIFKRVRRRWNGERYIQAMIEDLASRGGAEATQARRVLQELAADPDFYEPWD